MKEWRLKCTTVARQLKALLSARPYNPKITRSQVKYTASWKAAKVGNECFAKKRNKLCDDGQKPRV